MSDKFARVLGGCKSRVIRGEPVCLIYLDLGRHLSRCLLVQKIREYGIGGSGTAEIEDWLSHRKQGQNKQVFFKQKGCN